MLLLKPCPKVNQALRFLFAEAAAKFGIMVHSVVFLSNHLHAIITDPHGVYPRFLERFLKLSAKCLNAFYGRWGALWDKSQPSVVHVIDVEAAIAWHVYLYCNPSKANLVARVVDWPGVVSWRNMVRGVRLGDKRPDWFFDPNGPVADDAWVEIVPPPMFEGSAEEWRDLIVAKVRAKEEQYTVARARKGKRVLGRKGVLRQWHYSSPDIPEDRRVVQRRVAGHNKWSRIEAIFREKQWLADYAEALAALKRGVLDVVFPAHSWKAATLGLLVAPG